MTGRLFVAWVGVSGTRRPGPAAAARPVVIDHLACHEVAGVREAIAAVGCRLADRPPYSPDRNPIECWFRKFKGLLRTAAARTLGGLFEAMRQALGRFAPGGCRGYFRHCGYAAQPT